MKKETCQELFVVKKEDAPEIIKVKGVQGYVDEYRESPAKRRKVDFRAYRERIRAQWRVVTSNP